MASFDVLARFFALIGSSLPAFWTGLLALYVFYAKIGLVAGPGAARTRATPPGEITGFYTVDSLLQGDCRRTCARR